MNNGSKAFILVILMVIVSLAVPVLHDVGTITAEPPNDKASVSLAEELQTRWPISNSTTPDEMRSPFGPRIQSGVGYDFHRGMDLPAPEGTQVVAIMAGVVRLAGDYPFYSQPVVQVRHEYNGSTFYANYQHLSTVHVVEDQVVQAGDVLGETGSSPSGFEHLHFAIREEGVNKQDASHPLTYLPYGDQGPPQLEANWQGDILLVNVSVGNQELDFVQLDISGEGVDFHLNIVELNHATSEPDDLDNDTMIIGGVEMTLIPESYSQGQPRHYWFQFRFENETGDLTIQASDVLGLTTTIDLSHGPEAQNIQIRVDPMDVSSDVQLTWNASSDEGSISNYVVYRSSDIIGPYSEIANVTADGSPSYVYVDPYTGDLHSHFYMVHTRDSMGNQKQFGGRVAKLVVNLNSGWNVLSVPMITTSNLRTNIFASIDGNYASLKGYSCGKWEQWHSLKPSELNDQINVEYGRGYYIRMETDDYLVNAGEVNEISQIDLDKGWNLVGYPSFTSHIRTDGLNNLEFGTDIDAIQWFDATTKTWHFMGPDDSFIPGRGYWVHSKVDTTWEVPL